MYFLQDLTYQVFGHSEIVSWSPQSLVQGIASDERHDITHLLVLEHATTVELIN